MPTVKAKQIQESKPNKASQYLTFLLGKEEYGIEILKVQEIKGWGSITKIPNTPKYILGVINLRGAIIPVMDLRLRFCLESADYTPTTVIIVTNVHLDNKLRTVGLVVDAVSEVYSIDESCFAPAPELGNSIDTAYVSGLATVEGKMVILMAVEYLVSQEMLNNIPDSAPNNEHSAGSS
ncbi:MAG TPA: chemotaxis protein CheW [Gammaproteobacteria bacterium]